MTNEEFKRKNKEYLDQIVQKEDQLYDCIDEIMSGVDIPLPSVTVSNKILDLLETFENDGHPLDQHLTVILESQYLFYKYTQIAQEIQTYFNNLIVARLKGENEKVKELLEKSIEVQEKWAEMDSELENFDFKNNLADVVNTMALPDGLTEEIAYQICSSELKYANYTPKQPSEFQNKK